MLARVSATAREPVVIGLAGGVGAGKSAAARALADLGCAVVDSDAEARAALLRDEVRDELVRWWGESILDAEGRVDRSAVAKIVFADEAERRRLEGLIHPLLRRTREAVKAEAARTGAPAVVLDAPLLFEAGLDRECDAVIFVDAPREARLERVRRTRGWDEAELARREKSQAPLEDKRRRADYAVVNDGGEAELKHRIAAVFERIIASRDGSD